MRLAFVGGGVMGEAMLAAVLDRRIATPASVRVADTLPDRRADLASRYGVTAFGDALEATEGSDIVVLAVKPQSLGEVVDDLRGRLSPAQLVVSIVAGANLATLTGRLEHSAVVRVMPNTPAQIGRGMSVWTATNHVTDEQRGTVCALLEALGSEMYVEDEKHVDMATAVSGSGPAYVFLLIEGLIDAAVHVGIPRPQAQELVLQTVLGSAELALRSGKHPAELRNMVTSPGGTTAEGLYRLERGGLRSLLTEAVLAAYEKARLLGG